MYLNKEYEGLLIISQVVVRGNIRVFSDDKIKIHFDTSEIFSQRVLDAVSADMRWLGIVCDGFHAKMICNSNRPFVVVALRNKSKAINSVMLRFDNRVEGACTLIIENNAVSRNATSDK